MYACDWEPRRIVLFEFPSAETWDLLYIGPVYQGIKPICDAGSSARLVSFEGVV
jgi:uncharacterized protein (DUF1330 family)